MYIACACPPGELSRFLIKCIHLHWQSLPHNAALRGRFRAVWTISHFRPRAAVPCVLSVALSFFMSVTQLRCDTAISRHLGYIRPWGTGPDTPPFVFSAGSAAPLGSLLRPVVFVVLVL